RGEASGGEESEGEALDRAAASDGGESEKQERRKGGQEHARTKVHTGAHLHTVTCRGRDPSPNDESEEDEAAHHARSHLCVGRALPRAEETQPRERDERPLQKEAVVEHERLERVLAR